VGWKLTYIALQTSHGAAAQTMNVRCSRLSMRNVHTGEKCSLQTSVFRAQV
jgi:hypothetical protein